MSLGAQRISGAGGVGGVTWGWGVPVGPGSPHVALAPQACHVEGGSAGLVPSQLLEEKRKAFVKRDGEVAPSSGTDPPHPGLALSGDTVLGTVPWDLLRASTASPLCPR